MLNDQEAMLGDGKKNSKQKNSVFISCWKLSWIYQANSTLE